MSKNEKLIGAIRKLIPTQIFSNFRFCSDAGATALLLRSIMQASSLRRRVFKSLLSLRNSSMSHSSRRTITSSSLVPFSQPKHRFLGGDIISSPWSLIQHRGAKVFGTDVIIHSFIEMLPLCTCVCDNFV